MTTIAIDFGNTNTAIARWNYLRHQPEVLTLEELSGNELIPSVLYVSEGGKVIVGQPARRFAHRAGYFDQLKRQLTSSYRGLFADIAPETLGTWFWQRLLRALQAKYHHIGKLVITIPVQASDKYLAWLEQTVQTQGIAQWQFIDEPTAVAIAYGVCNPYQLLLVIDFGGGTLDIALVRLPESSAERAEVIAKAGQLLGGMDIDQWLTQDYLQRFPQYQAQKHTILPAMEELKIALSSHEEAETAFYDPLTKRMVTVHYTRGQLESLLTGKGFYQVCRSAVEMVINSAFHKGILKGDVQNIALVGGTALIPSFQQLMRQYFPYAQIHTQQALTAVVAGAITAEYAQSQGRGWQDHLFHEYAIRYWDTERQSWQYYTLFPKGQTYPTKQAVCLTLQATKPHQTAIELVVGEVEQRPSNSAEIFYEGDRLVSRRVGEPQTVFIELTTPEQAIAPLNPPANIGEDRIQAEFRISPQRQLLLTVTDLKTRKKLLVDQVVAQLH
jgi:molecular chaperone DnaK (HSP70)